MITSNTLQAALAHGCKLNYRMLDRIVVKGRSEPVEIYELWDASTDATASAKCKELYEAGLEHYFAGRWEAALKGFQESAEFEPGLVYAATTPSQVLAERCAGYIAEGGPEGWSGAYRMETK